MPDGASRLRYRDSLPRKGKALRLLWELVHLVFFRPTPRWALHGWRRQLLRILGAKIGKGCRISPSCVVWAPWNLEMGDYAALGDQVDCYNVARISIGMKAAISQRTFLCTASHDPSSLLRPLVCKPITIGNHAWVAAEAMVLPGTTIGEGAVVAARSVVTTDMPPWHICAGNPCTPKSRRKVTDLYLDPSILHSVAMDAGL
jgi:putative colanic acid biosynthesis acetyltransferase WcaF